MYIPFTEKEFFNTARKSFIQNDISGALDELKKITEFNTTFISDELLKNVGNTNFLNEIEQKNISFISGVFDCPYYPFLSLEYGAFSEVAPSMYIETSFKNIKCIRLLDSSEGLDNEQVVALFPENFRSIKATEDLPVFYIVNKFANRHLKYTRRFLDKLELDHIFGPLFSLKTHDIEVLVTNWVNIHESSHRIGNMPLPKFLGEKSNRFTAALEELRADLYTIKFCFNENSSSESRLTGLYVLAERLFAYPIFREKMNFDTISSVIFSKFLMKNVDINSLDLPYILVRIDELLCFINEIEINCLDGNSEIERKLKLKNFILEYLEDYNVEYSKYISLWSNK